MSQNTCHCIYTVILAQARDGKVGIAEKRSYVVPGIDQVQGAR